MERTASCACGQLSITVSGDPVFVAACSCIQCQKRTGSAFGLSSYFKDDQVMARAGKSRKASRIADSGLNIAGDFCPRCGSTVFWQGEFLPGHTGVAVGCFADPDFPEPTISVWNASKVHWVKFPETWKHVIDQKVR